MPFWYYDKRELRHTPSIKAGITVDQETLYRREGARFILQVGNKMGLRYETMASGVVFFHRFYMVHSFLEFPRHVTACCCLFLAGKVEETPKKCRDIMKTAKMLMKEDTWAEFGSDPREEVMTLERIILQTIKFDFIVEHPYAYLLKYAKCLKGDKKKLQNMVQMAWTFVNDSLCTTLCLQWEAEIIAIALMYLAGKLSKFEVTDWTGRTARHSRWWDMYTQGVTTDLLEDICHQVLDLYAPNKTDSLAGHDAKHGAAGTAAAAAAANARGQAAPAAATIAAANNAVAAAAAVAAVAVQQQQALLPQQQIAVAAAAAVQQQQGLAPQQQLDKSNSAIISTATSAIATLPVPVIASSVPMTSSTSTPAKEDSVDGAADVSGGTPQPPPVGAVAAGPYSQYSNYSQQPQQQQAYTGYNPAYPPPPSAPPSYRYSPYQVPPGQTPPTTPHAPPSAPHYPPPLTPNTQAPPPSHYSPYPTTPHSSHPPPGHPPPYRGPPTPASYAPPLTNAPPPPHTPSGHSQSLHSAPHSAPHYPPHTPHSHPSHTPRTPNAPPSYYAPNSSGSPYPPAPPPPQSQQYQNRQYYGSGSWENQRSF